MHDCAKSEETQHADREFAREHRIPGESAREHQEDEKTDKRRDECRSAPDCGRTYFCPTARNGLELGPRRRLEKSTIRTHVCVLMKLVAAVGGGRRVDGDR